MLSVFNVLRKVFHLSFNFSDDLESPGVHTGVLCLKQTFDVEKKPITAR
jgi:hypothetical protein